MNFGELENHILEIYSNIKYEPEILGISNTTLMTEKIIDKYSYTSLINTTQFLFYNIPLMYINIQGNIEYNINGIFIEHDLFIKEDAHFMQSTIKPLISYEVLVIIQNMHREIQEIRRKN